MVAIKAQETIKPLVTPPTTPSCQPSGTCPTLLPPFPSLPTTAATLYFIVLKHPPLLPAVLKHLCSHHSHLSTNGTLSLLAVHHKCYYNVPHKCLMLYYHFPPTQVHICHPTQVLLYYNIDTSMAFL